jgi:drug/metabolite transporter (DMT)-like permease
MNTEHNPVSFVAAAATLLLAIMLYDVMGAIIKHLGQHYPAQQLSMFRNLFGVIPALLILFWSKSWVKAGRPVVIRQWKLALVRGGIGALAQISFYLSLSHLEFATASTMLFAGPLFITALSIPLLGHRVGFWRWLAVLTGFTGVMLVMGPQAESFTWYAILPLCAAFGYASISVTSRLFDESVPTAVINLYSNAGSIIGSITLVVVTGSFVQIGTLEDWLWLAAMGVAGGTAAFCLISAYRMAKPSSLSPFEYFGIPFSFFLGWIFFLETPFDRLIPGVFLIVGGGLVIIWRERSGKNTT